MTTSKKKNKKTKKRFVVFLWIMGGLIGFWLVAGFFIFFHKPVSSIYVFPENVKQGDTVFIRVNSVSDNVTGNFGAEKLIFFREGKSNEWISFLGIDADQNPGNYKISISTSDSEKLNKYIKISLADFSLTPSAQAPEVKQNGITNQQAVENIRKNDNPAIQKVLSNFTPQPYFTGPFSFPLGSIKTSGFSFGKFISFAKSKLQHFGVDLKAPEKTDIYAVNDGKVVATLNLSNYGKAIIIDHGLDVFSMYLHLDQFKVINGQMVRKGQLIGLSGDTGYATAPHLHFSMRVGSLNSRVDPINFIEISQKMDDNLMLADISNAIFLTK